MRALAREPVVHFAIVAAALFALARALGSGDDVVDISRSELDYRILQLEAERGAPLTAEERRSAEEAYIEERILVLEARALGLEDDPRIDDILAQKMLHVLSGDVIQPTDQELADYYARSLSRYRRPERVDVDELVVVEGAPLPADLREGAEPEGLEDPSVVVHRVMRDLTRRDLELLFGEQPADTVFLAPVGAWLHPYRSVRGDHWLRIRARRAPETPPLADVRSRVRLDWVAEDEERRLAERVAALRARYTVRVDESR